MIEEFVKMSEAIGKELVEIRREIHRYPELGFEVERTARLIEGRMSSLGLRTRRVAGTGVEALLKGRHGGRTLAFRADMDALAIEEKSRIPYASKISGRMHACGHDAHVAITIGVAMMLAEMKNRLAGNVKFIFQPAEETTGGALPMIREDVLMDPRVDGILGFHVDPGMDAGTVGISRGRMRAASDMFDVIIYGKASHGAEPHRGIDAIAIGAQVISVLQHLASRYTDPVDPVVVSVGTFHAGSERNVIAETAEISGIVRTVNPVTRKNIRKRMADLTCGIAEAMGAGADLSFTEGYPCLENDAVMSDLVHSCAEDLLGGKNIILLERPSMGVDDFAYFLEKVPGAYFMLGVKNAGKGIIHPLHSSMFDLDEDVLPLGAVLLAEAALRFLGPGEVFSEEES